MMHSTPPTSYATRMLLMLAAMTLVVSSASAQAPLLKIKRKFHDPPLPEPCAAEGVCRPKRDTFGYYTPRWRRWPGDPATTAPAETDDAGQLPEIEEINPKNEDREAPPPSEERDSESSIDNGAGAPPQLPPLFDRPGGEAPAADDAEGLPELPRLQPLRPSLEAGPRDGASTGQTSIGPRVAIRLPEINQPALNDTKLPVTQPAADLPPAFPDSLLLPNPGSDASASHSAPTESQSAFAFATDGLQQVRSPRPDSEIRRASVVAPPATNGQRAFYQPDSPPVFELLGLESD